jgi:hypothetical protein
MKLIMINGIFDIHFRMKKNDKNRFPLVQINKLVDWELCGEPIEKIRIKERTSKAGRKPRDIVLMVKIGC